MSHRTVLGLVRDLFFRSKLDAVAESAGTTLIYASDLESAARQCAAHGPSLVIVDLSDSTFGTAEDTARKIRESAPDARIVGFASHIDLKPLKAARAAGFEAALSRSEFTARLPEFLGAR